MIKKQIKCPTIVKFALKIRALVKIKKTKNEIGKIQQNGFHNTLQKSISML